MQWTDIQEIVDALCDEYPNEDPEQVRFTDLRKKVCSLSDFSDDPNRCNERILEAIQMTWIDEISD
ncbi:MAG: Fe-S assembly protein IscX [Legionellales bacterium]|nr:Fe-S assembly protein IscX [Legionellales bacterium]|tara:strand:+ start:743 stop:940 length:198 start_codon:yes stop_codon:yes gene_type:complete